MKTFQFLLAVILALGTTVISYAQININITTDSKTDGSFKLSKKDSLHLKPFSTENFSKSYSYASKEAIDFELINSGQLKELFSKSDYTWVFIQSSWCGGCTSALQKHIRLADSLGNIRIIVVNQDIRVKKLQHKLYMEGYRYQSYILDPKVYGTYEPEKQSRFVSELTDIDKLEGYNPGSVPKNFFFDRDGNMLYFANSSITSELLRQKLFKKE